MHLYFWFPLSAVKSRFAGKILAEGVTTVAAKGKNGTKVESCTTNDNASEVQSIARDSLVCTADTTTECRLAESAETSICAEGEEADCTPWATEEEVTADNNATWKADRKLLKNMYRALKRVVEKCGHFTLIDFADADGKEKIKIII